MASKRNPKTKKPIKRPCPSCTPATKHECDTCDGTGCITEHADFNAAEVLLYSIDEDTTEATAAFMTAMRDKVNKHLSVRKTLEEVYLDAKSHPEVQALIRQGFRLKKSSGDRDVLVGPGGERRVIKRRDGRIHIVSEAIASNKPIWYYGETKPDVSLFGCDAPNCGNPVAGGHVYDALDGKGRLTIGLCRTHNNKENAHILAKQNRQAVSVVNSNGERIDEETHQLDEISKKTMKSFIEKSVDDHSEKVVRRDALYRKAAQAATTDISGGATAYYDEAGDTEQQRIDRRKEGILRALRKLTAEEVSLLEDPFLTPAKLHKYIKFGREDLYNQERSRNADLQRAIRHEDEAADAKTDADRDFHNERAKAFSNSAFNTDKAIERRKAGIATAAGRLLKAGGIRGDRHKHTCGPCNRHWFSNNKYDTCPTCSSASEAAVTFSPKEKK